jgi:hypothetical protein
METKQSSSFEAKLKALKPVHWIAITGGFVLLLSVLGSGPSVDPGSWTCESIKEPVIRMSKGRDLQILEIGEAIEMQNDTSAIRCLSGDVEWSQGRGRIEYGAEVSGGGNIILNYTQG